MNLSCSDCSQAASDKCSITPPGEEPALLTRMSTRPSALWPCATKFLASASLLRSAGIGTILRLVALAISAATSSSGSLRRAHMATSTPSCANARAMPLPMPALPPVTSAVLPSSLRSMSVSSCDLPCGFGSSRFVREPAARLRGGEELGERRVHRRRFLAVDGVARTWHHQQRRGRSRAFDEYAAVETELVLVADDHQQRHRELLELALHLPQRRPLELEVEHGVGVALGRVLRQHARELAPAARVFILERLPHRRIGVFGGGGDDAFGGKHLSALRRQRLHGGARPRV